jgi:hypothetical protein
MTHAFAIVLAIVAGILSAYLCGKAPDVKL